MKQVMSQSDEPVRFGKLEVERSRELEKPENRLAWWTRSSVLMRRPIAKRVSWVRA